MTPRIVDFSIRLYDRLLGCYPPYYQRRFRAEMRQVFLLLISARYNEKGPTGVGLLWLPILLDWLWTVVDQWVRHPGKESTGLMNTKLDQQVGDMAWSITTGLRANFDLAQIFEALSQGAPEPASAAARQFSDHIGHGASAQTALTRMRQAFPSPALDRLVDLLLELEKCRQDPSSLDRQWNHIDALELLSADLLREGGSDPAFYEFMRHEAEQLGASIPERARLPE